jgi:AAA domain
MKGDINDTLRTEGREGVRVRHDGARKFNGNGADQSTHPLILSKCDFLKGFEPPDYLIDGILQRRFIYSLTGQMGHAKTAVALLIAQLVSSVSQTALIAHHRVEKGSVIYLVGENPDDIRMRVIGADALREDDASKDRISFIPGVFNIAEMHGVIAAEIEKRGGADLVIVDTSAAYFFGNDEISNTQMGAHARMFRTLTTLRGGPCVLVLCHPIKHTTDPTQLLPRGGGAFLAEMDGNLTIWRRDDVLVELHYNKIRGPGFEPMTFKLEKITTANLTDKKGRLLPTVRAMLISESEEEKQAQHTRGDEDKLLAALLKDPDRSVADLARACDWTSPNGEPYKSKVHRILERLSKVRPKLVAKVRDQWALTDAGKEAARNAALATERTG